MSGGLTEQAIATVRENIGDGMSVDAAVRKAMITAAADAAHQYDRGCAGWLLVQRLYPNVTRDEWVTRHGDIPDCNGESLRGIDHDSEWCGPSCHGEESGCCGYCSECGTHHAEGEADNVDGDAYCRHCGRCSECEHECSDY